MRLNILWTLYIFIKLTKLMILTIYIKFIIIIFK